MVEIEGTGMVMSRDILHTASAYGSRHFLFTNCSSRQICAKYNNTT